MDWILQLDQQLFELINGHWHSGWLDAIMPWWRNKYLWFPLYGFLLFFLFQNFPRRAGYLVVGLLLTVVLTDTISSQFLKKQIQRPRPCHQQADGPTVELLIPCGSGYSFTSSHAANHMGLAAFLFATLGQRFRRLRWWWLIWAMSIGYAQIYVGVHYPLDVLAGSILGWLIGSLLGRIIWRQTRAYLNLP